MPRPLRPFAGRWSLVAAVLLPTAEPEPEPITPTDSISPHAPPSPARPPPAGDERGAPSR